MEESNKVMYYCVLKFNDKEHLIAATSKGLAFVGSPNMGLVELVVWIEKCRKGTLLQENNDIMLPYREAFEEYFQGKRHQFDLPLDIQGTNFQESVWRSLLNIPYGEVWTYSDIAEAIGNHKAVRAVASAIAQNPVMIVVPCHRVVRKNGMLSGYRGGNEMKKELLELEKIAIAY